MKENNYFEVFWKQVNPSTFMYGSKLAFKDGVTVFENPLMPSGIIIQDWVMKTNYALDKELPTLPILKRGSDYTFQFNYEVEPQGALYFKIIFYSKDDTVLSSQIIKDKEVHVNYPETAHTYKVQMINAAAQIIRFEKFTITEQRLIDSKQRNLTISGVTNVDTNEAVRNVVFVEPSQWLDYPLSQSAVSHLKNVITVEYWSEAVTDNWNEIKGYIEILGEDSEVHLISYGEKGNVFVSHLSNLLQVPSFITADKDKRFDQQISEIINEEITSATGPTEIYFDPKSETYDVADQAIFTVLNPSRYLKYLDVVRVNYGGSNETEN